MHYVNGGSKPPNLVILVVYGQRGQVSMLRYVHMNLISVLVSCSYIGYVIVEFQLTDEAEIIYWIMFYAYHWNDC